MHEKRLFKKSRTGYDKRMEKEGTNRKNLLFIIFIMLIGYVLLHDLLGGTLFTHSDWDSYTLQALSWREGRLDLGRNYEWLELAVYNGKYYVSFPPLPSLLILPLTFVFGAQTPNNLLMMLLSIATSFTAYFILIKKETPALASAVLSIFYVWGSNMLWMSTNGGVWFQAQGYNLLFLSLSLLCALHDKRIWAYLLIALAVGCRPFSALAFAPLFVFFLEKDMRSGKELLQGVRAQIRAWIAPLLIGALYMAFNYARFGNVLEFGHNYLPEFTTAQYGQFSIRYLGENLYRLLLLPVTIENGRLSFPYFNGFMFYIANPLFLLMFLRMLQSALKRGRSCVLSESAPLCYTRSVLLLAMLAMLLLTCLHKTLGGWQFGARYTVDMLPLALGVILSLGKWEPRRYEYAIAAFGVMFNFYGCMAIQLFI